MSVRESVCEIEGKVKKERKKPMKKARDICDYN